MQGKSPGAPVTKSFDSTLEDARNLGPREVVHWITTDCVDRSNEVVLSTGCRTGNFDLNRVVMYGHARGKPTEGEAGLPVGKNLWLKSASRPDGTNGILARTLFDDDPFALRVCGKYKSSMMTAWSVTFIPIDFGPPTREEIKRRPDWADADTIYRTWELVEYSAVAIPDNPEVVTVAKTFDGTAVVTDTEATATETVEVVTVEKSADADVLPPITEIEAVDKTMVESTGAAGGVTVPEGDEKTKSDGMGVCPKCSHPGVSRTMETDGSPVNMCMQGHSWPAAESKILPADPAYDPDNDGDDDSPGSLDNPDADEDEEMAEAGGIKRYSFVKMAGGIAHKGVGRVHSIHSKGMVPHTDNDMMASKDAPVARVQLYKAYADGHMGTEVHIAHPIAKMERIDDLKAPTKKPSSVMKPTTSAPVAKPKAMAVEIPAAIASPLSPVQIHAAHLAYMQRTGVFNELGQHAAHEALELAAGRV
jgi:hypothetical protein